MSADRTFTDARRAADNDQFALFTFCVHRGLFDVLNLFFDTVDGTLDIDDPPDDFGVGAFAADGIGLAEHFLGDKVQSSSDRFAAGAAFAELVNVAVEAADFFGDVAAVGVDGHFARQLVFDDVELGVGQQVIDALS